MRRKEHHVLPIVEWLDRFERTGLGGDLLALNPPDDPVAALGRGRVDALRNLARLRWYRYLQLPGVAGLAERRALLAVLARFGKRQPDLPEPLREFAATARRPRPDERETIGTARIDQLTFLLNRYESFGELGALDTGSKLAVRWLDETRLPYERAALRTYIAETAFRYGQAGAQDGYEAAEVFARQALADTEDGDPHEPNRLMLKGRCAEHQSGPDAVARALIDYRRAAELASDNRAGPVVVPLRTLGETLVRRYEATHSPATLIEALAVARDLDRATSSDDPRATDHRDHLDTLRAKAIERLGTAAVDAVLAAPADPRRLGALFAAADDDRAPLADRRIAALTLVGATPVDHPGRSEALLLATHLELDLWRGGAEVAALDDALDLAVRAYHAAPPGSDTLRRSCSVLAEVMLELAHDRPAEDLADQAVTVIRQARKLLPENGPGTAGPLNHLAVLLVAAANVMNDPTLLPEAVEIRRAAVRATPRGSDDLPFLLANLATSLKDLAHSDTDPAAMEESISIGRQALAALPADDPRRVGLLFNLATALSSPVSGEPAPERLDESERLLREGQALLPAGHPDHARFGSVRAFLLYLRHRASGERQPLVEAVALAREAVAHTPHDDPWWPERNRYLAHAADTLYRLDGKADAALREDAMVAYAVVAESQQLSFTDRVKARRARSELALTAGDPATALHVLETALDEIPRMARRALVGPVRRGTSRQLGDLAADAAAAAIAAGRPDRAVELLERSRAVLYSEALTARRYWEPLREIDPQAAAELERIESRLAEADLYANLSSITATSSVRSASGRVDDISSTTTDPRPGWAAETRRLAAQRDRILDQVANDPRFEELLRPPTLAELRHRAAGAPIAIVLAHRDQGHALIVPGEPDHPVRPVPLPDATQDAVRDHLERLQTAVVDAIDVAASFARREAAQHELHEVLEWLWDAVTGPVLAHLDLPPAGALPRLWWCPVGALVRLPLHAAGHHREPGRNHTVLDRVVSSYTPTIGTLAHTLRNTPARTAGTLVVAVPEAPDVPPLPHAEAEAAEVLTLVPEARALIGPAATRSAVETAMKAASIVHFACHGDSDTGFTLLGASGLHLGSGETLTSASIHDARLEHGELAFLSACGTAEPHPILPDEPMHLAAAFQVAGFRGVIGTMWRAPDSPRIARAVYTRLTNRGSSAPNPHLAATALNDALREARDAYPSVPTRWAAYLHVGA